MFRAPRHQLASDLKVCGPPAGPGRPRWAGRGGGGSESGGSRADPFCLHLRYGPARPPRQARPRANGAPQARCPVRISATRIAVRPGAAADSSPTGDRPPHLNPTPHPSLAAAHPRPHCPSLRPANAPTPSAPRQQLSSSHASPRCHGLRRPSGSGPASSPAASSSLLRIPPPPPCPAAASRLSLPSLQPARPASASPPALSAHPRPPSTVTGSAACLL